MSGTVVSNVTPRASTKRLLNVMADIAGVDLVYDPLAKSPLTRAPQHTRTLGWLAPFQLQPSMQIIDSQVDIPREHAAGLFRVGHDLYLLALVDGNSAKFMTILINGLKLGWSTDAPPKFLSELPYWDRKVVYEKIVAGVVKVFAKNMHDGRWTGTSKGNELIQKYLDKKK